MRIFYLLTLFFIIRCSSDKDSINIEERNGIMYKKGTNELFTGIRTEDFENGKTSYTAPYENGLANGKTVWWHENGKKKTEGLTKNGKKHGEWKSWYNTGILSLEYNYIDDQQDGRQIEYFENGKISFDGYKTKGK